MDIRMNNMNWFSGYSLMNRLVLVYKCGQEKLNNLYYQVKEQRRCSAWRKTKNPTPRNASSNQSVRGGNRYTQRV